LPASRCSVATRSRAALFVCLLTLLLCPGLALACPACIQSDQKARTTLPVVMSFLGVPFGVFGGAVLMIRRRTRARTRRSEDGLPVAVAAGRLVYPTGLSAAARDERHP
jgi:hypothetical protein